MDHYKYCRQVSVLYTKLWHRLFYVLLYSSLEVYNPSCYGYAVILDGFYLCSKISEILSSNDIGLPYVNRCLK